MSCRYRPSFSCLTEVTWQLACRSQPYCPGGRLNPRGRPARGRVTPREHFGYRNLYAEQKWGEISMTADITEIDEASLIRPVERPVPLRQAGYEALGGPVV